MCGRFSITSDKQYLEQRFRASFREDYNPRFNAAPNQKLPVIEQGHEDEIVMRVWGLRPRWYQEMKGGQEGLINVRDDNLKNKRTFEKDLLERRCLVLADGFYEWVKRDGKKVPYRFELKDREPFVMAGICQENVDKGGEKVDTFAIITTEANDEVGEVHSRMPVVLSAEEENVWLEGGSKEVLLGFLNPLEKGVLEKYEVSTLVNSPMNDGPEVMQEVKSKK